MTVKLREIACVAMILLLAGCANMIPLADVNDTGTIDGSPSKEQIREAIEEGALNAGWSAKAAKGDRVIASYHIRSHRVIVEISYTDTWYDIEYKNSFGMKIYCTRRARDRGERPKVSGQESCPGHGTPVYIHHAYQQWVNNLKSSIDFSLAYLE